MLKHSTALLATTAIIFVAGCNRGANNTTANKTTTTTTTNTAVAAPAPMPAPAVAGGAPVDAALLTAHAWAPAGGCAEATTFNADGTLQDEDGPGTWTLQGSTLTFTQNGQPQPATVTRSGDNMVAANPANPTQSVTLMRCPAGAAAATDNEAAAGEEGEQ